MSTFWEYEFKDDAGFVETYDELPLWSAPFGLLLLKHIELQPNQTILDIGCGTGFPLIELAERLGNSCTCYGLDIWENANTRANKKIKNYGVSHVQLIPGSAENIPLGNESVDIIVSNLGINNFENPQVVFAECYRVLKPNGKVALTTNLNGHWKEFYSLFEETLRQLNKHDVLNKVQQQQEHRGTIASISKLFTENGFAINRHYEDKFEMRFLNGTAFLNHHFVKLGWLSSWKKVISETQWPVVFTQLEEDLNRFADGNGGLSLTVPMAFIEGKKV